MQKKLGHIISGSLADGFIMRLDSAMNFNEIKTGRFICISCQNQKFFSLVTDLQLQVTHPDILLFPPKENETLLTKTLKLKDIYATALVKPMLMLSNSKISPVKTIPYHFAPVFEAENEDIALIFGSEDDKNKKYFNIGTPLDMDAPVCLDLEQFTARSSGIFGKTGTGKTFLTRLVLAGLIRKEKAVTLIFDMHSEYGSQARKEGNNESFVKGLKTLFPNKVAIFSLDPTSTRRRGSTADYEFILNYKSIYVDDIISLHEELNLHPTACESAYLIAAKYKKAWLKVLLEQKDRLKEFAAEVGANPESISALYRKLRHIERLPFFVAEDVQDDIIDRMMECIDRGISVIIEFGNYSSTFCYLLIANIITRRIHTNYVEKTEKFLGTRNKGDEPKKLLIVIEEAHKFLNAQAAKQTIFGTIAREMRKYYVSLLVVDQRPSGIDPEILSQIGTKIVAQLNDEKDIQAVLTGANNAHYLRNILSTLDSKKQIMIIGHAISMPVVVQAREYDEKFYKDISDPISLRPVKELIDELY
ncbi:ATP-binding protein [Candidatus Dependentiae bacterium]|nr:ATP-binding protein [Candidatus Dependentiae bacterium]